MSDQEKPNGDAAGWRLISTDYPFTCRVFRLRRDRIQVGDRHELEFAYLETKGAVWIVPVTTDGKIVLIRQYRYAVDDWVWEVPAGGLFDHEGNPESLAAKELAEEIGGQCEALQYLGWFYGGPAISDLKCHVFIAHNTRLDRPPALEPTEMIQIHTVSIGEALQMARDGRMLDGRSSLALLRSEPHLRPGLQGIQNSPAPARAS